MLTCPALPQEAEIDSIHQLVVGATENIKEGNEDIREVRTRALATGPDPRVGQGTASLAGRPESLSGPSPRADLAAVWGWSHATRQAQGPAVAKRQGLTSLRRSLGALGKSDQPRNPVGAAGETRGTPGARALGAVKAAPVDCWAPLYFECGPGAWADVF